MRDRAPRKKLVCGRKEIIVALCFAWLKDSKKEITGSVFQKTLK